MTDRNGLRQAIDQAENALLQEDGLPQDRLILTGHLQGGYSTPLIVDPSLTGVDVRIYLFLCQYAAGFDRGASPFPTYELICRRLKISRPTVANSMTRLRLTRWATLLRSVRDSQGRFRGQIYAFQYQPLCLGDTLTMDQDYMKLVNACAAGHGDKRTRLVAQGVLAGIDQILAQGGDPMERPNMLTEWHDALCSLDAPPDDPGLFFGIVDLYGQIRAQRQQKQAAQPVRLKKTLPGAPHQPGQNALLGDFQPSQDSLPGFSPSQNALPGQKSPGQKTLLGASPSQETLPGKQPVDFKENEKTLLDAPYSTSTGNCISTSTAVDAEPQNPNPPLNWHPQWIVISDNHRIVLERMLKAQAPDKAQILLDALAYRYQSVQERGSEPLRSPVTYARSLLKRLATGTLVPVRPEDPETLAASTPKPESGPPGKPTQTKLDYEQIQRLQEIQGLSKLLDQLPDTPLHQSTRAGLQRQIQSLQHQLGEAVPYKPDRRVS